MPVLAAIPSETAPLLAVKPLEHILVELTKVGSPGVRYVANSSISGWLSTIEMNVSISGSTFTISSEYRHPNPHSAVMELADRVKVALASMRTATSTELSL